VEGESGGYLQRESGADLRSAYPSNPREPEPVRRGCEMSRFQPVSQRSPEPARTGQPCGAGHCISRPERHPGRLLHPMKTDRGIRERVIKTLSGAGVNQ
jgi:hypothetical protein